MQITDTALDEHFQHAASVHLPGIDWRWLKAQGFQESSFNPRAKSPVGAMGIMQIMPGTWSDMRKAGNAHGDPYNPVDSIYAGAYYLSSLVRQWTSPRPPIDRLALSLASYNAGIGHLLTAQKRQGMVNGYAEIIQGLRGVTGDKSRETVTYVSKIFGYYSRLVLG